LNTLSQRVERKLIQQIKHKEAEAGLKQTFVLCDDYIALANLYRANQLYQKELTVLSRFVNLGLALHEDIEKVELRIREVKALLHQQRQNSPILGPQTEDSTQLNKQFEDVAFDHVHQALEITHEPKLELTLEAIDDGQESFWHPVSSKRTSQTNVQRKAELPKHPIKLVSICAGYTGKTQQDEIFELALIAFEYCQNNDMVLRIIDEYHGLREPNKEIPATSKLRFGINLSDIKNRRFDHDRIQHLMTGVKSVISHNDPYIERQLFLCHFPAYAKVEWRSSQQDIPWKALGFSTTSLSNLAEHYQLRTSTRTPMERAKTIIRLLAQYEPDTDHTLLKRLMSCSPMAPMKWTQTLKAHSQRLNKRSFLGILNY
jgi:hypothetical protein